jgi:hypothetical protein
MNSTKNIASELKKQDFKIIKILIVLFLAIIMAVLSSLPNLRSAIGNLFSSTNIQRKILSKIFLNYDGTQIVAYKIKTVNGIELEIYEKDNAKLTQNLKHKFSYPKDKDAFLIVEGNSINLGSSDINGDDIKEIIMPTVDQFGVSRLNIIRYNSQLKQFSQSIADESAD